MKSPTNAQTWLIDIMESFSDCHLRISISDIFIEFLKINQLINIYAYLIYFDKKYNTQNAKNLCFFF